MIPRQVILLYNEITKKYFQAISPTDYSNHTKYSNFLQNPYIFARIKLCNFIMKIYLLKSIRYNFAFLKLRAKIAKSISRKQFTDSTHIDHSIRGDPEERGAFVDGLHLGVVISSGERRVQLF